PSAISPSCIIRAAIMRGQLNFIALPSKAGKKPPKGRRRIMKSSLRIMPICFGHSEKRRKLTPSKCGLARNGESRLKALGAAGGSNSREQRSTVARRVRQVPEGGGARRRK